MSSALSSSTSKEICALVPSNQKKAPPTNGREVAFWTLAESIHSSAQSQQQLTSPSHRFSHAFAERGLLLLGSHGYDGSLSFCLRDEMQLKNQESFNTKEGRLARNAAIEKYVDEVAQKSKSVEDSEDLSLIKRRMIAPWTSLDGRVDAMKPHIASLLSGSADLSQIVFLYYEIPYDASTFSCYSSIQNVFAMLPLNREETVMQIAKQMKEKGEGQLKTGLISTTAHAESPLICRIQGYVDSHILLLLASHLKTSGAELSKESAEKNSDFSAEKPLSHSKSQAAWTVVFSQDVIDRSTFNILNSVGLGCLHYQNGDQVDFMFSPR